jgi:hypothetical protein
MMRLDGAQQQQQQQQQHQPMERVVKPSLLAKIVIEPR